MTNSHSSRLRLRSSFRGRCESRFRARVGVGSAGGVGGGGASAPLRAYRALLNVLLSKVMGVHESESQPYDATQTHSESPPSLSQSRTPTQGHKHKQTQAQARVQTQKQAESCTLSDISDEFDIDTEGEFDDRSPPISPLPNELVFDLSQIEYISDSPRSEMASGYGHGAGAGPSAAGDGGTGTGSDISPVDKEAQALEDRVSVLFSAPLTGSTGGNGGGAGAGAVYSAVQRSPPVPWYSEETIERVTNALKGLATPTGLRTVTASRRDALIPLVVRTLAEYRRSARVVHAAMLALTEMARSPPSRSAIADCGGLEATLDAMRLHSLQPDVQAQACLLLGAVAHHTPAVKPRALDAGALLLVVGAMATHPAVDSVQTCGCLVVRTLCRVDADSVRDPHAAATAVEVCASALDRAVQNAYTQAQGSTAASQALVALANAAALSEVAKARMRDVNAVASVVRAVDKLRGNVRATDAALSCLSVIVTDLENQRDAVAQGAVTAIDNALQEHANDPQVVCKAAACLRFLTFDIQHRMMVGIGGLLPILVDALDRHQGRTLREVMHALGNSVAGVRANKVRSRRGVSAASRVIMEYVNSDVTIVEDACRLLYALTVDCEENQRGVAENGTLSALLEALRIHACTSPRVAEHATAVFVVVAYNRNVLPDVQKGASDLASILRRARDAHRTHTGFARQSRALVGALGIAEEDMALAWPSGLGDPWKDCVRRRSDLRAKVSGRCRHGSSCI